MSDWGSTHLSPKIIIDEAAGLAFCCWNSSLALHYYLINITVLYSQVVFRLRRQLIYVTFTNNFSQFLWSLDVVIYEVLNSQIRITIIFKNTHTKIIFLPLKHHKFYSFYFQFLWGTKSTIDYDWVYFTFITITILTEINSVHYFSVSQY